MALAYKDIGKGKTIVFIHSYLWDKNMWLPQLEFFKKNYRCISIDLPGHGESAGEKVVDLKNLAELIKETIEFLKISEYTYVGLSVGGMIAPYLYEIDKKKIEKIIIMDSFSGAEPEQSKNLYFGMLDIIEKNKLIPNELIEKIAPIFFQPKIKKDSQLFLNFKDSLKNISKDNIDIVVNLGRVIFGREESLKLLSNFNVPTFFLTGEYDIPRPFYEAEKMKKLVKNSKIFKIKNAGHISNLENPKKVNRILNKIFNI